MTSLRARAASRTPRPGSPTRHATVSGACTVAIFAMVLAVLAPALSASGATRAARSTKSTSLRGVTITFGDQLKEFQTIFAATDALKGAPYTVNWTNFIGGPPVIAAETSGSVDIGDMAETPTIFAQAAGDPVKVVAATVGISDKTSPYAILVPAHSPIRSVAQLRGHTVAVQEGTVEQYYLVQALAHAHVPYDAVHLDNLTLTTASTAVTNGQVDAAVVTQPLIGLDQETGKVRQISSGAGLLETIGYLTASDAALANPQKAAALSDFIERFYKAEAVLAKDPGLAAQTYAGTYGVPLSVAKEAVASAQTKGTPITSSLIGYQQNEADTFQRLGLVPNHLNVKSIFDLPFNAAVSRAAGLGS
jgi:sulfonate transport system substrate-binding protein